MIALCPGCAHENRQSAFFCAQCGTKVHFDTDTGGRFVRMNGAQQDRRLDIPGPVCVIGRDPSATLRLEEDSVSKQHARLTRRDDGWEIEDLGSSNGTFVNGRRVHAPDTIRPGDLVRLGTVILKFEV